MEESTLVAVPVDDISAGISAIARTTVVERLPVYLPVMVRP